MTTTDETKAEHPPGEYCIVELMGHTTLVGRYAEIEKFGCKMLAIEPLFAGALLPVVFQGGPSIYRLTPCSAEVAWAEQPRHGYQLPPSIKAIVPTTILSAPESLTDVLDGALSSSPYARGSGSSEGISEHYSDDADDDKDDRDDDSWILDPDMEAQ